jgi:hypothetical protein
MDTTKKQDSGFKLDVSADIAATSSALNTPESLPSNIINPLPDLNIPNNFNFSPLYQPDIKLPESTLFQPTDSHIQPQSQAYKSFLSDTNFAVKIQPEEAMKKATEVAKHLESVRKDVQSLSDQMRNSNVGYNQRDNFEEKVTIPAQNDIFTNRKSKMTEYPDWR